MEKRTLSFTATVIDPIGLHARPAAVVVKAANQFKSQVTLTCDGKEANLKSIMNVLALGVKCHKEITITAQGKDAGIVIAELEQLMKTEKII